MYIRRQSLFLLWVMTAIAAVAYNVTGVVTDRRGSPLPDATVRILQASDSAFINGNIADNAGRFRIGDINSGHYLLEISYIGYAKKRLPFTVVRQNVALDTIHVNESDIMLGEATVVEVKPAMKVMQDTVEYNAESYKTPPNAMVEDLLRRLPGVELDSEGKITANGKEVTKILVDGKEFFSDDPAVASKNLPVEMLEKVQVIDRKSDLAQITGVDDGEEETVINLTVKKGMKKGWVGSAEGGYGTDDRYRGALNVNHFRDDDQATLLAGANNVNDLKFTNGASGRFGRQGSKNGISVSQGVGGNFNIGNGEIFRVGGDVMYSHVSRKGQTSHERQYLTPNNPRWQSSYDMSDANSHSLRADFRVEWKPDSFNTLDFRPTVAYTTNHVLADGLSRMTGGHAEGANGEMVYDRLINRDIENSDADGKAIETSGRLIYSHRFRSRRGRSFSISAGYNISNNRENEFSSAYTYLTRRLDDPEKYRDYVYEQQTDNHRWSTSVNVRVTWTEPLGDVMRGNYLTLAYQMQYRRNNADKISTQRSPDENPWYPDQWADPDPDFNPEDPDMSVLTYGDWEFMPDISNRFRNDFMNQNIRLGYKKVNAKYNLETGIAAIPSMSRSRNLINSDKSIPKRCVWNYAPFLRYRYKMSRRSSVSADYSGRSSQPSLAQLQPVADNSNPLRVVQGNPNLAPSFRHSLRLRFQKFRQETQQSLNITLDGDMTQNAIITKTTFDDATGGRYTTYENINGVWNARLSTLFGRPLGRRKLWSVNSNLSLSASQGIGYNNGERNVTSMLTLRLSPSVAYRPEDLEIELRPNWRFQKTYYSLDRLANRTVHHYGGSFYATWYAKFGLVLATDLHFNAARGYASGYNDDEWMWNASVSYQFLSRRQATITLKGYDLLQMRSNVNHTVTANYVDDSRFTSLTRYFMLTFTYKINTLGRGHGGRRGEGHGGGRRGSRRLGRE